MIYITPQDPRLISYQNLRRILGFIGILLPLILIIGNWAFAPEAYCGAVQYSISHYYYTVMGDVFIGALCAIGLFLMVYKGFDAKDNILTNIAGIFAFGVAFFPTDNTPDGYCAIRTLHDVPARIVVHFVSAGLLLVTLAIISIFLFTLSKGHKTPEKIIRNKVYRICGIVMLAAVFSIFVLTQWFDVDAVMQYQPVFWLEWLALAAFGVSWLVKGEFVLKDK